METLVSLDVMPSNRSSCGQKELKDHWAHGKIHKIREIRCLLLNKFSSEVVYNVLTEGYIFHYLFIGLSVASF